MRAKIEAVSKNDSLQLCPVAYHVSAACKDAPSDPMFCFARVYGVDFPHRIGVNSPRSLQRVVENGNVDGAKLTSQQLER